ncbi:MAG: helicase HerA domain-containing protein, partial [Candidatus Thorarchaeota archaeon]
MKDEKPGGHMMGLIKLIGLIALTIFPQMLVYLALRGITNLSSSWLSTCYLVCGLSLFVGWGALIYIKKVKIWAYAMGLVIIIVAGSYLVSLVTALSSALGPLFIIPVCAMILGGALHYYRKREEQDNPSVLPSVQPTIPSISTLIPTSRRRNNLVAGVEVSNIPREYIEGEIEKRMSFQSILRHLTHSGTPIGLRFLVKNGDLSIIFTTWAEERDRLDDRAKILLDTLRSNLPEFGFRYMQDIPIPPSPQNLVGGCVVGIPLDFTNEEQNQDGISASISLLHELSQGALQITFEPRPFNPSEVKRLESAYRQITEASETTISKTKQGFFSDEMKESKTQVDARAKRKAEKIRQQIERLSNKHLCIVRVNILSWGLDDRSARQRVSRAVSLLMGTLRPNYSDQDFEFIALRKQGELFGALRGLPQGKESVLTIGEAVNYLQIPSVDVGISVSSRSSFGTSTESLPVEKPIPLPVRKSQPIEWIVKTPIVVLGNPLTQGGIKRASKFVWFKPSDLDSHLGIYGNTRSGKTTTARSISAQLEKADVNPIVIVPFKPENWRSLLDLSDRWRTYTVGNDDVAPLAFNGFNLPKNVVLSKWIPRVENSFNASMPNDAVLRMHVDDVVRTAFRNCRWSVKENKKGRPVLLTDLWDAMLEVGEKLEYGEEVKRNIKGALEARLRSIIRNPALVSLFNTNQGISIEELLAHPTIIEIDRLSEPDKQLFIALLTAGISEYYLANPQDEVRNVLVLEEAHILLRRSKTNTAEGPTAHDEVIASINEMLRTVGGTGLGIITMDQLLSSMNPESVRLPVNTIIHAMSSEYDRKLAGGHARCKDEQLEHIAGMEKGETIVFLEREKEPKNVQIIPVEELLEEPPLSRNWDDARVKKRMAVVY